MDSLPIIRSLDDIVRAVQSLGDMPRVAIARSAEDFVLRAGLHAYEQGVAEPVLIGDADKTREVADRNGLDISSLRMIHMPDDGQAVTEAVRLFREGEVSFVMKGLVPTATLLKAVLNKETGVPPETGILSHVGVFTSPTDERIMFVTDAGVNIAPNLQRKVDILKNAIGVARTLGIAKPRCALLAATEKVNYPAMPATLDGDVITKMASKGEFGEAEVHGPLSLDLAVNLDSAACKGVSGPVAGQADILLTPDIESGNILYKSLSSFCRVTIAGVVVGSRVPVVVPSRGDSDKSKFYSLALAAYLGRRAQQ
ncbi:bifunctional enoyl-CoA hydratase/phosphate acetyltransferase [Pseudodesulfovibrio senegalensis]|uniref:Bifunctional enoyl-CoA hydratase/phosphate acetyltransferase n=1 Tax=Pseudodesulfovibrio senegalensis TaxID=1721087 RepID=A0A6N6MZ36_9BACT|nr:bifunctional enoyl-CoA hydratase/phosphate acetyltransferase [Pseudodesulfovibrio senegalensis]KAB1440885.1 bifunctional enoyl-CoA hydratase/phosphate acetyltransferase [Pseudodesulfovibrio senegalensis]